jgi:hypothetical protein
MQATDAGQRGAKALLPPESQQVEADLRLRLADGTGTLRGNAGATQFRGVWWNGTSCSVRAHPPKRGGTEAMKPTPG